MRFLTSLAVIAFIFLMPIIIILTTIGFGVCVYSFITLDTHIFGYFVDLFNPVIHMWVRITLVIWCIVSIIVGTGLSRLG